MAVHAASYRTNDGTVAKEIELSDPVENTWASAGGLQQNNVGGDV